MIPRVDSSHAMAMALLLSSSRLSERGGAAAPRLRATSASAPSSARVLLYLPLAWLLQLVVADLLHLFFHACTALSTSARGWGWGVPGHVLWAVGHTHTVHHKHIDAFGTVNQQYKWSALLLDKLLKRSLIQFLSWRLWCRILWLDNLMEDFMHLPRSSAPLARFAMVLLTRVEALRSAVLVVQTVLHHWKGRGATANGSRHGGGTGCPIARLNDHPPLSWLPRKCAQRLAVAIGTGDPQALLQWRVFTTPVAHSLHHYNVWNFPFQVVDWRALFLLLRGGRLEWAETTQAADIAWGGLMELPANSRRTSTLVGQQRQHVHAVSLAPVAAAPVAQYQLGVLLALLVVSLTIRCAGTPIDCRHLQLRLRPCAQPNCASALRRLCVANQRAQHTALLTTCTRLSPCA